jgi:hypothetical protein
MVTINSSNQLGSQALPISTLDGNSGSATGSTVTIETASTSGTTAFTGSGSTLTLNYFDVTGSVGIGGGGTLASNTGLYNTSFGYVSMADNTTGHQSAVFGALALSAYTGLGNQVAVGFEALTRLTGDATTAGGNVAVGIQAGANLTTGELNVLIGPNAGGSYTTTESSNILLGFVNGTVGESNTLRIGNATGTSIGNLNAAYICGIEGVTIANTAAVLISTVTNQLGTVISSRRFKENIQDMGDVSEVLYKLRPTQFTLKAHPEFGRQTGLIAEEVFEVAPQLVALDEEGLPRSVCYHELPALLLNEIQKLKKEIYCLKKSLQK